MGLEIAEEESARSRCDITRDWTVEHQPRIGGEFAGSASEDESLGIAPRSADSVRS